MPILWAVGGLVAGMFLTSADDAMDTNKSGFGVFQIALIGGIAYLAFKVLKKVK